MSTEKNTPVPVRVLDGPLPGGLDHEEANQLMAELGTDRKDPRPAAERRQRRQLPTGEQN